jgi:hypothetical protein
MEPLHGRKTHPLSEHALEELRSIEREPIPRLSVNPGVANRLLREALVESVLLPSPFKAHQKRPLEHLQITGVGRARLKGTE